MDGTKKQVICIIKCGFRFGKPVDPLNANKNVGDQFAECLSSIVPKIRQKFVGDDKHSDPA